MKKRSLQNKTRPTFEHVYLILAIELAERSTCKRLKVGCVITSEDFRYVYAVGYNGNASGLPNTCDTDEPGKCGCLHSEENAAINNQSPRSHPKVVFITHLPCSTCAKRIINLGGVKRLVYINEYRDDSSKNLFKIAGIKIEQWGKILDSPERFSRVETFIGQNF